MRGGEKEIFWQTATQSARYKLKIKIKKKFFLKCHKAIHERVNKCPFLFLNFYRSLRLFHRERIERE